MMHRISFFIFWSEKAFVTIFGSILGNAKMLLWGIHLTGIVKCVGIPRIESGISGRIRIGKRGCLRSARCSNIAGILRPVSLGTIGRGKIELGDDVGISSTVIVSQNRVSIGNRVQIGVNCTIVDTDFHPVDPVARARGDGGRSAPIILEDDVWLGMNVIVLKGVRIGRGSVVAAGSVVIRDLPCGVLAGGNPARGLRPLAPEAVSAAK